MNGRFALGGKTEEVSVDVRTSTVVVRRGDRVTEFEFVLTPVGVALTHEGRVFDTAFGYKKEADTAVVVNGRRVPFRWVDARDAEVGASGGGRGSGGVVKAVMPGRVVRIDARPGMTVKEGEPLLVLEAMKMENEIKAPFGGVVATVEVAAGDSVETGAALVHLSPLPE
jgi:biotin carboxyl carrier protein